MFLRKRSPQIAALTPVDDNQTRAVALVAALLAPWYYMKNYTLNPAPFVVPTTDGKRIEEHVGYASTGTGAYSLAHMVAPPQWSEPHQTPAFDEMTIVVRGRKRFEIDGDVVELAAGQALLIKAGARVRYSNPFAEECEYWSVCVPAFSPATVNREE